MFQLHPRIQPLVRAPYISQRKQVRGGGGVEGQKMLLSQAKSVVQLDGIKEDKLREDKCGSIERNMWL